MYSIRHVTYPKLLLSLAAAFVLAAPGSAVAATCYADWTEAAPIVTREKLRSAREVQEAARRDRIGDIVRITLCLDASDYVYRLLVRDAKGRISNLRVDARLRQAGDAAEATP